VNIYREVVATAVRNMEYEVPDREELIDYIYNKFINKRRSIGSKDTLTDYSVVNDICEIFKSVITQRQLKRY
jgi:hypothetical protein